MYVKTELNANQLVYSMTKMVSVTRYVCLITLKRFNIYEFDYVSIWLGVQCASLFWMAVIFKCLCRIAPGVDMVLWM